MKISVQESALSTASPVWQFLLASLPVRPDPERLAAIAATAPEWDALYTACRQHGVFPLVNSALSGLPGDVLSGEVRERFLTAAASRMLRNLAMRNELHRLLALITGAGIPVIPFKGPVLAEKAWGDAALRDCADLDLLVPEDAVLRVVDLLTAGDYVPEVSRRLVKKRIFLTLTQHVRLLHPSQEWMVEVHKALFPEWRRVPLCFDDLWHDSGVDGSLIGTLSDEDTLLLLCIHGTLHQWSSVKWVVDVDRFVCCASGLAWEQLLPRAASLGCRRAVLLGLRLAQECCGTLVPEQVQVQVEVKERRVLGHLQDYVIGNWFEPQAFEGALWRRHRFTLDARERFRDRLSMMAGNARMRFFRSVMRMPV